MHLQFIYRQIQYPSTNFQTKRRKTRRSAASQLSAGILGSRLLRNTAHPTDIKKNHESCAWNNGDGNRDDAASVLVPRRTLTLCLLERDEAM